MALIWFWIHSSCWFSKSTLWHWHQLSIFLSNLENKRMSMFWLVGYRWRMVAGGRGDLRAAYTNRFPVEGMRYGPRSPIHPLRSYWPRPSRKSLRAFSYPAQCNKTGPYCPHTPTSTSTTHLLLQVYYYYPLLLLLPFFHQVAGTVAQDVPNGLGMGGLSLLVDDNGGNVNNPQLNGPQSILVRYQFQYQSNWVAVMLCHL